MHEMCKRKASSSKEVSAKPTVQGVRQGDRHSRQAADCLFV